VPSAIGARHTAIRYLQSHECVEKLKRNMREEHVLKLDWISTLFKHVGLSAACVHKPQTAPVWMWSSHRFTVVSQCLSCGVPLHLLLATFSEFLLPADLLHA